MFWARGEYLGWGIKGFDTPALVTSAPRGNRGVIGLGGTVIYGNERLLEDWRNGGRMRLGRWLDCRRSHGLQGEYLTFGDDESTFSAYSNGLSTLARPYIDAQGGGEAVELVGYLRVWEPGAPLEERLENAIVGGITVNARSEFHGAGIHWLGNLLCEPCGGPCGARRRVDLLLGYRYLYLRERLTIREDLYSLDPGDATVIPPRPDESNVALVVQDEFRTQDIFNGGDVGLAWTWQRNRWSLEFLTKLALGGTRQRVTINGSTTSTDVVGGIEEATRLEGVKPDGRGVGEYTGGGLLAQRSNIGTYNRDVFSLVPELNVNLAYELNRRWRATVGYTLVFWTNVARPGDQIDRYVNPDLAPDEALPAPVPSDVGYRPRFAWKSSTLWAQGVNVGLEYTW
jgi:hypothetical protein